MSELTIQVVISNGKQTVQSTYTDNDEAKEFIDRITYEHEAKQDAKTGGE